MLSGSKHPLISATTLACQGLSTIFAQIRACQACRAEQPTRAAAVVEPFPKIWCTTTTPSTLTQGLSRFFKECVVVVVLFFAVSPTTTSVVTPEQYLHFNEICKSIQKRFGFKSPGEVHEFFWYGHYSNWKFDAEERNTELKRRAPLIRRCMFFRILSSGHCCISS